MINPTLKNSSIDAAFMALQKRQVNKSSIHPDAAFMALPYQQANKDHSSIMKNLTLNLLLVHGSRFFSATMSLIYL